jgi:hypothetical protein
MKRCRNCGSTVTEDYARVFGDNDNRVHSCGNCEQNSRGVDAKETGGIGETTIR